MSLEVSHLLKIYGTQKAVNDVSFQIGKGEIVGFLGPNGAGKSTTMKMITGYLQPDDGQAIVCGINTVANPLAVKKKIGYLPEANPLYYDMYVKEYLQFVAGVHQLKNIKDEVNHVITLTGLTPESKKKIGQLSKGYKQRVGLAAALVHHPEVLILDEPTSGLDPNQIVEIRNVIKEQGKDKTVLFSSHILQEVQAICDRVIIINKGQLVADDTLYNLQQGAGNVVQVTFKEAVPVAVFKQITSILQATPFNEYSWQLTTNNTTETRRALLELALQNNLNIVSLQTAGSNLEEVFKSLTGNVANS
jgi:ABC-2 type transport system ATP-binding protein